MNILLSPSLLSANFCNLGNEAARLEECGITWLYLDVMDGSFVPNISFGPPVISSLRKACRLFFDVHLMIERPENFLEAFCQAGADILVPHIEAMTHPQSCLAKIRSLGMKSGVALDPDTNISRLRWLLPDLDMILIMGVNPGFSGQKFLSQTVEKIACLRKYLDKRGFASLPIQVDGGVDACNIGSLAAAGAAIAVSGSAFFRHTDFGQALAQFEAGLTGVKLASATQAALAKARTWQSRHC